MIYFVYDLDNTLYQMENFDINKIQESDYKYLKFLLKMIPFKQYVFTNANNVHANMCLNKMNIIHNFSKIVTRDTIRDFKPFKDSYTKFMDVANITNNDKIIFFEDTMENLEVAKLYGWHTIYIGKDYHSNCAYNYIDKSFNTIEDSLEHVISNLNRLNH